MGKKKIPASTLPGDYLNNIFHSMFDGLIVVSPEGNIITANPAVCSMLGYKEKELMEKSIVDIFAEEEFFKEAGLEDLIKKGVISNVEKKCRTKNGRGIPVLFSGSVMRDKDSKIQGIVCVIRDITKQKEAEEEIKLLLENERKSAREWREIFDSAKDIISLLSPDFEFLKLNKSGYKALNKKPEEVLGKKCYEVVHGLNKPIEGCPCLKTIEIGKEGVGEVTENGRYCLITTSPVFDENKKLKSIIHTAIDITERKKSENEKEKIRHDLDERVKELNCLYGLSKLVERHDYSLDKIIEGTVELLPPSWQYPEETVARIVFDGKEYKTNNYKETKWKQSSDIKFRGNKIGLVEICYLNEKPELDEGPFLKEERKLLTVVIERLETIIKNKSAGEELDLQSKIIENMSGGVYLVGYDDVIIKYTNPKFEKLFGYNKGEMIGKHVSIVNVPTDLDPQERAREIMADIRKNGEWHGEVNNIKKDGTPFWSYAIVTIFNHFKYGKVVVAVHTDITKRKKAEEEREKLHNQLIQSEKMSAVGQLASGVAHEFNNLLAIILGNTQLFKMTDSIDEIKNSLEVIETAAKRGRTLVKDLSVFSKPKDIKIQPIKICNIINEVIKLQKKQLVLENIRLKIKSLSCPKVLINWGKMEQVLVNLFINARHAIQFKKKGEISIIVKEIDDYMQIRFSDTGIGMDEDTMKRIFEPFFTTKGAYAKDGLNLKGSGLGLSVTYTIIQQYKGTIEVESEKGKGTTFIINLPVAKEIKKTRKTVKEKKTKPAIGKTKDLKILIVDDEKYIINLMRSIFNKAGYKEVIAKNSGKQALNVLKTYKPDVIFLDMLMPDMSGEELLKKIKAMRLKVPVVFISGKVGLKRNTLIGKGAFDLIEKPFDVEDVFRVLNKVGKKR